MKLFQTSFRHVDFAALLSALVLASFGLVTMYSGGGSNQFFDRQIIWLSVGLAVFSVASIIDWRFLRRSSVILTLYGLASLLLLSLFALAEVTKGAQSWLSFGGFSFQPVDLAKLALIALLAKYFTRRHIEIAHIRHIIVSGIYALVLFALVAVQPDFGSAIILFAIWFGMVLVSGISLKHLFAVVGLGVITLGLLWTFGFHDYQKQRILTFLNPLSDIRGAGYNAYQSTVAVGSGQLFGKGIGYGTQSKLRFLPEYETDFVFAAFAEEWGFVGVLILCGVFGLLITRLLQSATKGASNFETLFTLGVAIYFMSHFLVHVGINIGLLPVTGTTIPFMSYGGSHVLAEFLALGIVSGMRRYARAAHRDAYTREFQGGYDQ